jgi:hypothetical protein
VVVEPPYFFIWMFGLGQMGVVGRGGKPPSEMSLCKTWQMVAYGLQNGAKKPQFFKSVVKNNIMVLSIYRLHSESRFPLQR